MGRAQVVGDRTLINKEKEYQKRWFYTVILSICFFLLFFVGTGYYLERYVQYYPKPNSQIAVDYINQCYGVDKKNIKKINAEYYDEQYYFEQYQFNSHGVKIIAKVSFIKSYSYWKIDAVTFEGL